MLDRLSALMPDWRERNPADLWVALAEAVAFRADELSYFQDAVATEAYLGTARQRVSVRRHARLLDYAFHDGCNARAWIAFEVDAAADGLTLPGCDPATGLGGTLLLTRAAGPAAGDRRATARRRRSTAGAAAVRAARRRHALHRAQRDRLPHLERRRVLPAAGRDAAFLRDDEANRLRLRAGDVLVLEALPSTTTGERGRCRPSAAARGAADARRSRSAAHRRRARRARRCGAIR